MSAVENLKPLLHICASLGIVPWYNGVGFTERRWYRLCLFGLVALVNCWRYYSTYMWFLKSGTAEASHVFSVIVTASVLCKPSKNFVLIFTYLDNVDKSQQLRITRLKLLLLIFEMFNVTIAGTALWVWLCFQEPVGYMVSSSISIFYVLHVYILEFSILRHILVRLRTITKAVEDFQKVSINQINDLIRVHWNLCETIHHYNAHFGWPILLQTLYTSTNVLAITYHLLISTRKPSLEVGLISSCFTAMSLFFVFHTKLAQDIKAEFRSVSRKADELMHKFLDKNKAELLGALKLWCEQASKQPQVTAADFFAVDYATIITIFGIFSSFIILTVQSTMSTV